MEITMKLLTVGTLGALGGLMFLGACGSSPQPTERLASAEAAMRAAKEVGASQYPQAQLHTQLAQEELEHAQKLIKDGDNERAERLLWRATADAELAIAVTREATARSAATAAESGSHP
jgi:Domain of unknown function (DUF4398)